PQSNHARLRSVAWRVATGGGWRGAHWRWRAGNKRPWRQSLQWAFASSRRYRGKTAGARRAMPRREWESRCEWLADRTRRLPLVLAPVSLCDIGQRLAAGQFGHVLCFDVLLERLIADFLHQFAGKAVGEYGACAGFVDTARTQIEDGVFIELADCGAVRALDVVGVDLQLRLGVDLGLFRQQQRIRRLFGIGFLRVLVDDHLAVEHTAAAVAENAFEYLAAGAVLGGMIDTSVVVDVLAAVGDVDAVVF